MMKEHQKPLQGDIAPEDLEELVHGDTDGSNIVVGQGENLLSAETPGVEPPPPFTFDGLSGIVGKNVQDCGWKEPFPVQAKVIPWLLKEEDVIVQSRTGSGKTGAFILPLATKLNPESAQCQALIMVPTRELANQVKDEFDRLLKGTKLSAVSVYGGVGYKTQLDAFRAGTQVVIGTPGRILDHLGKGSLNFRGLRWLVIDEADELLSMGFYRDMMRISRYCPKRRVSAMFSATVPESVKRLSEAFLQNPVFLSLSTDGVHVSEMDHVYYVVDPLKKDRVLMRVIELDNPANGIIFCNTRDEVTYVAAVMKRFGYDVEQISGDVDQREREAVMGRLKNHDLRFLVATDVAARGIDISHLEYVFLYDMHKDFDQYIHRAGRTGRAGNRGIAVSFVSLLEESGLKRFANRIGLELIKKEAPTREDLQNRVCERVMARMESELRDIDSARKERMQRFGALVEEIGKHEFSNELQMMILDTIHQSQLREGRVSAREMVSPPPVEQNSFESHSPRQQKGRPRSRSPQSGRGGRFASRDARRR